MDDRRVDMEELKRVDREEERSQGERMRGIIAK